MMPAADGNHAAVRDFAYGILELDGGVMDVKSRRQLLFYIAENAFTLRGRDIVDTDMAGERMSI